MRHGRRLAAAFAGAVLLAGPAVAAPALAAPAAAAGTPLVAASSVVSAGGREGHEPDRLSVLREATDRYHNLAKAEANGYAILADVSGQTCIDEPGVGGMGVHYVNGDLVGDPAIHLRRPEAMVYRPTPNGLRLAAVEYVVIAGAWDAAHTEPPSLLGQMFMLTPAPNRYGLPPFYSLHVWAWDDNPAGTFAMWNPDVVCPAG